jgi:ADP-ribosylglycohydrolase
LENFGLGKRYPNLSTPSNEDANAFTKVVPLAALCHNASNLPQLLADAIQLNQSHPTVVAHGVAVGLFLSALVGGASPSSALAAAKSSVEGLGGSLLSAESASSAVASLQEAEALVGKSHEEVLEAKGRHCNVINQTISSVQLVLQGKSYVEAVRETIRGGGDNGSRAVLVGACVAAVGGGVPVEWVDSSVHAAEIKKLCKE